MICQHQRLDTPLQERWPLENRPRLRECSWIFSAETATAFLSFSLFFVSVFKSILGILCSESEHKTLQSLLFDRKKQGFPLCQTLDFPGKESRTRKREGESQTPKRNKRGKSQNKRPKNNKNHRTKRARNQEQKTRIGGFHKIPVEVGDQFLSSAAAGGNCTPL